MIEEKEKLEKFSHATSVPSCLSFAEAVRTAGEQLEIGCCSEDEAPMFRELCKIVAEAYMQHPQARVYVNGEQMQCRVVQEVFAELTHEHVMLVMQNYNAVARKIHNVKAYLRTALYNSVFELEASCRNSVNVLFAGGKKDE